jgi:hypothetical protein
LLILLGLLQACSKRETPIEQRKEQILAMETNEVSPEALNRKTRSIAFLNKQGLPAIEALPVIGDSQTAKKRTKQEIAQRAIALCIVASKGEGIQQATIDEMIQKYGAQKFFTPKEITFLRNPKPTPEDLHHFSWAYEGYWVLLWSLGYVDQLGAPLAECDVPKAVGLLQSHSAEQFINSAKLRSITEILDAADLYYRYDWIVVDAGQKEKDPPGALNPDVVSERHYTLNWLIGYLNQEWDDISTDT